MNLITQAVLIATLTSLLLGQSPPDLVPMAERIRAEAVLPNNGPMGHPLPLVGHWNAGQLPGTFLPAYQLAKIVGDGKPVILSLAMPGSQAASPDQLAYYETVVKQAAALRLPISFDATQFEQTLYWDPQFFNLPAGANPNVIGLDGVVQRRLDPMGPVQPWHDVGVQSTRSPILQKLQEWYPNPPLVLIVSNNEAQRIGWYQLQESKRFVDLYGTSTPVTLADGISDDTLKRGVCSRGWIERYRAMVAGLKEGLASPAWKANSKFIGFEAFPPALGSFYPDPITELWKRWIRWTGAFDRYLDPNAQMWEGGEPPAYLYDWRPDRDDTPFGPQGFSQDWPADLQEVFEVNPAFWTEITMWDGAHAGETDATSAKRLALSDVVPFTPNRYQAMSQFVLWMARARSIREYRDWTDTVANAGSYWDAVISAVEPLYRNSTLEQFWRYGTLVPNPRGIPYTQYGLDQCCLGRYINASRWFILDTTLDPPHPQPFGWYERLPIFSLAVSLGNSPSRQWLLYAQAPMGDKTFVGIMLPGYGQVTVDVPIKGAYYLVKEGQPGVQLVRTDGPSNVALTPTGGSGSRQQFAFSFQKGTANITGAEMLINAQWTGINGCYIHYTPSTNFLWLFDNKVQGGSGVTPGSSGVAENSQCVLLGKGASVSTSGRTMTVVVDVTFKPGFDGTKNVYMQVQDSMNQLASWVRAGTWSAVGYANFPRVVSLSPLAGKGPSASLTGVYHVPNGAEWAQIQISTTVSAAKACYISYYPATNTFRLFNDAVTAYSSITGGSNGSIENSQCVLMGKGSSAKFSSGDLTVNVDARLKPAFGGLKQVRLQTMDLLGYYAPWVLMGTWSR